MMRTRQIDRSQWRDFLHEFSRQHDGWIASVEVMADELGAQREVENRPFHGVVYDPVPGDDRIEIMSGDARAHMTHTVQHPRRIWLEQTGDGADRALQIESDEGEKTLIRFRWTLSPDLLDPAVE